jgi:hypothetical protein
VRARAPGDPVPARAVLNTMPGGGPAAASVLVGPRSVVIDSAAA